MYSVWGEDRLYSVASEADFCLLLKNLSMEEPAADCGNNTAEKLPFESAEMSSKSKDKLDDEYLQQVVDEPPDTSVGKEVHIDPIMRVASRSIAGRVYAWRQRDAGSKDTMKKQGSHPLSFLWKRTMT